MDTARQTACKWSGTPKGRRRGQFGLRDVACAIAIAAVYCGMLATVPKGVDSLLLYSAFGVGLLAQAGYPLAAGRGRTIRFFWLGVLAACAASTFAVWSRGHLRFTMLVGGGKFPNAIQPLAETPGGCLLTVAGFCAFWGLLLGGTGALLSGQKKLACVSLVLLWLWWVLWSCAVALR